MTKEAWVELIISHVAGGAVPSDLDSRYHPLVIGKLFDVVYASIIYQTHANAVSYKDWAQLDAYVRAYKNVPILLDTDRNEYYSKIPAPVMELPMNRGVRLISPMKEQKLKFIYRDNNSIDVYDELEVSKVVNKTRYYVEGGLVFYDKLAEAYIDYGLLFKLIVPMSEFDDDEEIGIPANRSAEVFAMMTDLLLKRPPEDVIEDNNSKQV